MRSQLRGLSRLAWSSFPKEPMAKADCRQVFWLLDQPRTPPSRKHTASSGEWSLRPQLQRRDRDGITPSSLFFSVATGHARHLSH
jgi:hypothetical protein